MCLLSRRRALLLLLVFMISKGYAHPLISGLERFHDKQRVVNFHAGRLLMEELRCVACHEAEEMQLTPKQAPRLESVSGRIKAGYLRQFIANPAALKPGTTMPNLFSEVAPAERDAQVRALVHYLISGGPRVPPQDFASVGGRRRGEHLFHSVGCVACHGLREDPFPGAQPLGPLTEKYTLPSLSNFLQHPLHSRPSGRMPNLNLSAREAHDIAAYLLPQVPEKPGIEYSYFEIDQLEKLPDFATIQPLLQGTAEQLVPARQARRQDNFALQYRGELVIDRPGDYSFHLASDDGAQLWIDDQLLIDNDGVHGMQRKSQSLQLDVGRHGVRVDYFERSGGEELEVEFEGPGLERTGLATALVAAIPNVPLEAMDFVVDPELAERGRILFSTLGCASCHEVSPVVSSQLAAKPWADLDPAKGCLADEPRRPADYQLSGWQRVILRETISEGVPSLTAARELQHAMLQMNCVACHARNKLGGVRPSLQPHFQTTQQEMGVEGSIPPDLDGVGAKLTDTWLTKLLANGAKDRPYMLTRMPKFGEENVGQLADLFSSLDAVEPLDPIAIDRRVAKRAGHRLVGTRGFSCIKCHTFGRYQATGVQSIDLTIMTDRLREDWFRRYVRNPQVYRRGTRMPSAWPPTGPSLIAEVLDGDSDRQIAAVWTYLRDGIRAKTPAGLATSRHELVPDNEAIIYRNFIDGAGSRAIAVGYPEGIHIAFDAHDLRLALLWQGAFMDASRHWSGRGQGFEPPAGEKVQQLVAEAALATLETVRSPWPATQQARRGARFLGYRLTSDQRPTFLYRIDGLQVEDFVNPVESETSTTLTRSLTIVGRTTPHTYLRLAAGQIAVDADGYQLGNGLQLKLPNEITPVLRTINGVHELLLPVHTPGLERTILLEYVW